MSVYLAHIKMCERIRCSVDSTHRLSYNSPNMKMSIHYIRYGHFQAKWQEHFYYYVIKEFIRLIYLSLEVVFSGFGLWKDCLVAKYSTMVLHLNNWFFSILLSISPIWVTPKVLSLICQHRSAILCTSFSGLAISINIGNKLSLQPRWHVILFV